MSLRTQELVFCGMHCLIILFKVLPHEPPIPPTPMSSLSIVLLMVGSKPVMEKNNVAKNE